MKRFNLLLVTQESGLREVALRTLSKVFKSNFVFEVLSLEEAKTMLAKLHIDILLVDLDVEKVDLVALGSKYPHIQMMGLSANPSRITTNFDPSSQQILEKRDLANSFFAELKDLRKEMQQATPNSAKRRPQAPAEPNDFADFSKLATPQHAKK